MAFQLTIDTRERDLISALSSDDLQKECGHVAYQVKPLQVGDLVFTISGQPVCLVERKTFADYASSIADRRNKNQAIRIQRFRMDHPDLLVVYLVEGHKIHKDHRFRGGITRNSVYSSMINKVIRDRMTVFRSSDISDSALIVAKLYSKLQEHLIKKTEIHVKQPELAYLKTIKLSKKENLTPDSCYLCQLAQIPGLSLDTAKTIADVYPSFYDLVSAYQSTAPADRKHMLSKLSLVQSTGKTRHLGKVLSERIYRFVCPLKKLQLKKEK